MDDIFDKVREYAYKSKDEASKLTKQVIGKTGNIITQTKLNFTVSDIESKIKDIYTEIGKRVYERYEAEGTICEPMDDLCSKIDDLKAEAEDLKEKLAELKDSLKCPKCGEFNKSSAVFCSKCGTELKTTEDKADEVTEQFEADYEEDDSQVVIIKPKKPEGKE